ncbi:hypothetical protein V1522DRAFT_230573 [Lipomyces starkeyi]
MLLKKSLRRAASYYLVLKKRQRQLPRRRTTSHPLDLIRFPRTLGHKPEMNEYNTWAYKVTIKSTSDADARGLVAGKTVAIKDNICIGSIPSCVGTDVIAEGGFVPQIFRAGEVDIVECIGKTSSRPLLQLGRDYLWR